LYHEKSGNPARHTPLALCQSCQNSQPKINSPGGGQGSLNI
jgi:hypothetical protein